MKAGARKAGGVRQAEALAAIKLFEEQQVDWNWNDLAKALGISVQHARNVMEALTLKGALQHSVTIVRKRRLVLTPEAPSLISQAA